MLLDLIGESKEHTVSYYKDCQEAVFTKKKF